MLKKKNFLHKNQLDWKENNDILKAVSLLSQLGLIMAVAIIVFIFLGFYFDKLFDFKGLGVGIGAILGVVCGGFVDWKLLSSFFEKNHHDTD